MQKGHRERQKKRMEWQNRCNEIAIEAVSRENILSLLKVMVNNLHLSYWNLLFVYEQNPDARHVCGRRSWEMQGRQIKAQDAGVKLLLPKVTYTQGHYRYSSLWVWAYGEDDTTGEKLYEHRREPDYADLITKRTGATWELVNEVNLQEAMTKGRYDAGQNVFYLCKGCTKEQLERTELSLYLDYVFLQEGLTDKLLRFGVSYVIFEHFHIRHTVVGALFGKLSKFTGEEKVDFLIQVRQAAVRVISDLEGYALDWEEAALVNDLMICENRERLFEILDKAASDLNGEEMGRRILELKNKLAVTRSGFIQWLYQQRAAQRVYSFPPIYLEMEREDFLRAERSGHGGK